MFQSILVRFKWPILAATLFSVIGAVAGIAMLKIITLQLSKIGEQHSVSGADFALFVVAVVAILSFGLASRYLLAKLSAQVVYEFRDQLAKRLLCTDYAAIERLGGHRILAAMKTDASKLSAGLLIMPGFIYSLVTVLLCLGYMMFTSMSLFGIVFVLISAIILLAKSILTIGLRYYQALRQDEDELFSGLTTLVQGVKELSINTKRRRFVYRNTLLPNFANIQQRSIRVSVIFTMLNSMASTLVFFVIGVIVFGSALYWQDVPSEAVMSFVLTILYMINPMESIISALNQLSDFAASYRNIQRLELASDAHFEQRIDTQRSRVIARDWQRLSIEAVSFQYQTDGSDDYQFAIGPISTELRRGDAVYLTGGNGSGKSTFAKLVLGLYQATGGQICLDGTDVSQAALIDEYQDLCSAIFSDFHLFEHVLDDSGELADDNAIAQHLTALEMAHKVTSHGGHLSSIALSQGQKKRLALAMSYLENTPICLYDEWAADQDPRFRELFYSEIIPELKRQNKLVLVITHDDKYFHLADQLLRFEQGQLVEDLRPQTAKAFIA